MSTEEPKPPSETSAAQYEFTEAQNETIDELSKEMNWVSLPMQVIGIFYAISFVAHVVMAFEEPRLFWSVVFIGLGALIFLSLGGWTRKAAFSFGDVANTSGRDIDHLMEALDNLRKKYSLLALFVKIYVAILLLSLIAMIIAWATGQLTNG